MSINITGKATLDSVRIRPGFSVNFPTGPLSAQFLVQGDFAYGNYTSSSLGSFDVQGNNIIANLNNETSGSGLKPPKMIYSNDAGATWSTIATLPEFADTNSGAIIQSWPYVWSGNGGNSWDLWSYSGYNAVQGRFTTTDGGLSWTFLPTPKNPSPTPIDTDRGSSQGWAKVPGSTDTYYYFGQRIYWGADPAATRYNNIGLFTRDRDTGNILASYRLASSWQGAYGVIPLENDIVVCLTTINGYPSDPYLYVVDMSDGPSHITNYDSDINIGFWETNGKSTILFSSYTGQNMGSLYQWTAPDTTAPWPEITLAGKYSFAQTLIARKSYMWLVLNIENDNTVARAYYSTDEDGSTFSSTPINITLPSLPKTGGKLSLKAGPGNWWYLLYTAGNVPGICVLTKFQFETVIGNPPQ